MSETNVTSFLRALAAFAAFTLACSTPGSALSPTATGPDSTNQSNQSRTARSNEQAQDSQQTADTSQAHSQATGSKGAVGDLIAQSAHGATDPSIKSRLEKLSAANGRVGNVVFCDKLLITGVVTLSTSQTYWCSTEIHFSDGAHLKVPGGETVFLNAPSITVNGTAYVDGRGSPGVSGTPGESRGKWSSQGDRDFWDAVRDCHANPPANPKDIGGNGGDGTVGGSGALVVLRVAPTGGNLVIDVTGGPGGAPGAGGAGKELRNGRNNYCDGCINGCPNGRPGKPGPQGPNGSVVVLQQ